MRATLLLTACLFATLCAGSFAAQAAGSTMRGSVIKSAHDITSFSSSARLAVTTVAVTTVGTARHGKK